MDFNAEDYKPTASTDSPAATAVAGAVAPAANTLTDTYGNPTAYQISLWENKHGRKIKQVEVGGKVVCFIQPPRPIVEAAYEVLQKTKKPLKYAEVIMQNCQLNYLAETAEDEELFHALANVVDQLVTSLTASLKN